MVNRPAALVEKPKKPVPTETVTFANGADVAALVTVPVIVPAASSAKSLPVVVVPAVTAIGVPPRMSADWQEITHCAPPKASPRSVEDGTARAKYVPVGSPPAV